MKSAQEVKKIVSFLRRTYKNQKKTNGIIAVSGGIDSALSLTLLTKALGPKNVYPVLLPYGDQSIADSELICSWNKVPKKNWQTINIKHAVDTITATCHSGKGGDEEPYPESRKLSRNTGSPMQARSAASSRMTKLRLGNAMARTRMIYVFDKAKELNGLVCGTENKSEHYLGYFTRFGDAASDIEPIAHLYKTHVRELVKFLDLPEAFLEKAPSAGLWEDQTDENEMGFSYEDADKALAVILDESKEKIDQELLKKVKKVVTVQAFKHQVPYKM
ncbi:MAG TPA: NAD(+) synthase [Patescibacteria group bacterium]|nr:NAD(+) synthase [Patescibacteria group bacterium]